MDPTTLPRGLAPLRDSEFLPTLLLVVIVALWLAPRFLGGPTPAAPAAVRAIAAVHAGPSPETGRLEVWGLPHPDSDPADLLSQPAIVAARARLREQISAENDALALRVADAARRLEPADDDVVGLRLSGWLIPFYDGSADELLRLREDGLQRPWEALRGLTNVLEARLEEPPDGVDVGISGQRRDLTRLFRQTGDALRDAEANTAAAVESFRQDALGASADAAGPFRRRGRGRIVEIVLAALLGASVRETVRRRRSAPQSIGSLAFAPVLGLGCILPLEGSSLLPVSPLAGTSLAFLPMAFVLGFASSGMLSVLSRLDRLFEAEPAPPAAPEHTASAAAIAPAAAPARKPPPAPIPPMRPPTHASSVWPRREEPERPAEPDATLPVEPLAHKPDRELVRTLAQQVMTRLDAEAPRSERELEEDPGVGARPRRPPEKLPFFPRRR